MNSSTLQKILFTSHSSSLLHHYFIIYSHELCRWQFEALIELSNPDGPKRIQTGDWSGSTLMEARTFKSRRVGLDSDGGYGSKSLGDSVTIGSGVGTTTDLCNNRSVVQQQ
jgi:hypothetical protein